MPHLRFQTLKLFSHPSKILEKFASSADVFRHPCRKPAGKILAEKRFALGCATVGPAAGQISFTTSADNSSRRRSRSTQKDDEEEGDEDGVFTNTQTMHVFFHRMLSFFAIPKKPEMLVFLKIHKNIRFVGSYVHEVAVTEN